MLKTIETQYGILELRTLGKKELDSLGERPDLKTYIEEIGNIFSVETKKIYGLEQVHGTEIYTTGSENIQTGDGIYTTSKDAVLFVKTADCMPIFFWSQEIPLFGVLHSGWKGTRDGITNLCIQLMKNLYPSLQLNFYLGPCIRREEYEVREDVSQFFDKFEGAVVQVNEKLYLGLDKVIETIVGQSGFTYADSRISNFSDPGYFSHRKGDTGRNLNTIRILP